MKVNKKKPELKKTSFFSNIGLGGEKDYFIENVAMLLSAGIDILSVFKTIREEMRSKRMRQVVDNLINDINTGSSLWQALDNSRIFPSHAVSLVKMGEKAGRLSENLKVIVIQQQKERIFRSKIRSAMMYPILVFSMTVVIGLGITWFILPRLATVFAQLKVELPFFTKALMALGNFLGSYGSIAIPAFLLLLGVIIYFLFIFPQSKSVGQKLLFRLPIIKRLIQEIELGRFGYILGTLLKAGLPVVDSINSLYNTATFYSYKQFYSFLKQRTEEGNSFQKSFELYKKTRRIIPAPIQQMIVAAERSGHLPETLIKIGQIYEEKTEDTTKNLTVILEPILLVIVWLVVLAVALAVITPIYSLIGGLNQQTTPARVRPKETITVPKEPEPVVVELPEIEVLADVPNLNVRRQPLYSGEVIIQIHAEEIYEYSEQENGWYKIILSDEETGWVIGEYVSEVK